LTTTTSSIVRISLVVLGLGGAAALAASCSNKACGAGTQEASDDKGNVVCVAVTVAHGDTICDADGGVQLVEGNRCVSVTECGAGTMYDPASHKCIGQAQQPHQPLPCTPPGSGKICVNGTVRNLVDGSYLSGQSVKVTVYDANSFFMNPTPAPLGDGITTTDTFHFPALPKPAMYILVVTSDPDGAPGTYQRVAIGFAVADGQGVQVDPYALTKSQYDAWALPASFLSQGALFYRFFNDPLPPADARTPTETHPVAGVTLTDGTNPVAGARYFGATLAATDTVASMTAARGAVIVTAGGLSNFTGTGGAGVSGWEAHQALPIPNIVQVDFFHPQ
jgi:hypothetical protein